MALIYLIEQSQLLTKPLLFFSIIIHTNITSTIATLIITGVFRLVDKKFTGMREMNLEL